MATKTAIENGGAANLPEAVRRELRDFINTHDLADTPLAVRSSATAEDSSGASFAGIHQSVLNVRGLDAIESAIKDFWILQARPVTRLPRKGPPALLRLPQYWSTANIKDSVPGVLCELSWSNLRELVQTVTFAALYAVRYDVPEGMELVRRFKGHVYFDLTLLQWTFFDAFGVLPEVVTRSIGGHQPNIGIPSGNPLRGLEGRRRRKASLRLLRALWSFERKNDQYLHRYIAEMRSLAAENLDRRTTAELSDVMRMIEARQIQLGSIAGLANSAYGRWFEPLEKLLQRKFGARGGSLLAGLSSASRENVSAEQGYRIMDLARIAQLESDVAHWIKSSDARSLSNLPQDSLFRIGLEHFLSEFGHRAPGETDIVNPRWIEDASSLFKQIRDCMRATSDEDLRNLASQRRLEAEREIRDQLPLLSLLVLWMANRLRRAYAIRELGKSALVAGLLPYRQIVLEIGRRLVASHQFDERERVFDLTATDLRNYLKGFWDGRGARELTNDRRRRREEWLREDAPDVIAGEGVTETPFPISQLITNEGWRGIAVSAGRASGNARVITTPQEGARLLQHEILVAPSTDPGWTPLFLKASAVVMETGGYLSHGAIVAREYGLPAVVNIPGVLAQVHDGEMLGVNGDEGTVVRLNEDKT